ncbi:MAG: hypothetical protein ACOYMR_12990 [Ilumatobacteraceae bacterium]
MSRRPQRLAFGGRGLVLSLLGGMIIATAVGASAASLGGLRSNTLYSTSLDQTVPPNQLTTTTTLPPTTTTTLPPTTTTTLPPTTTTTINPLTVPVACDSFTTPQPTKNNLDGRPVGCGGGTWTVNTGDWQIAGKVLRVNGAGQATVVGPTVNASVEVSISHFDNKDRIGGLILNRSNPSGTASMLAGVIIGPNIAAIQLVNGSTITTLATGTIPGNLNEARLRFTRLNNTATLRVNGVIRATVTLTPTQLTVLNGTRHGIYQLSGNALRYWDFALYPASP